MHRKKTLQADVWHVIACDKCWRRAVGADVDKQIAHIETEINSPNRGQS